MKKNEDEITELFRSRLKKYEIPLQEDMWEKLESELSKPSPKRIFSIFFIAAAAVFLLLLACSAASWLYTSQEKAPSLLSKASVPVTEKHNTIANAEKEIVSELPVEKCNEPELLQSVNIAIDSTINKEPVDSISLEKQSNNQPERSVLVADIKQDVPENVKEVKSYCADKEWAVGLNASIEAGKMFASVGDNQQPINIHYQSPISLGISICSKLSDKISLESGLNYTLLRSELKEMDGSLISKQNFHFLGIPLKVNCALTHQQKYNLYLSAGGMMEECISPKDEYYSNNNKNDRDYSVNRIQFSLTSSIGVQYNATEHMALFAEPGVAYYFDDKALASTIRKERPLNFNLRCGVRLMY